MSATWTTREGKVIPVAAMTDEHLTNAYRMVRRMGVKDDPRLAPLRDELVERLAMGKRDLGTISDEDHADLISDCVVGGCDNYGSLDSGQE